MLPYGAFIAFGISVPLAIWFVYSHRRQLMGRPLVNRRQ